MSFKFYVKRRLIEEWKNYIRNMSSLVKWNEINRRHITCNVVEIFYRRRQSSHRRYKFFTSTFVYLYSNANHLIIITNPYICVCLNILFDLYLISYFQYTGVCVCGGLFVVVQNITHTHTHSLTIT